MRHTWKSSLPRLLQRTRSRLDTAVFNSVDELRDSEAFLSSVIENIPNMIFVKEAATLKFVSFNRAGEKLLGQRREDLIGKNDFDFFPREQAEAFVAKDREVLASGKEMTIEEEQISVPGGIRLLQTRKLPLLGPDGKVKYLLGISEDITQRKEHEKQKNQLQAEIIARQAAENIAKRLTFLDAINKSLTTSLNINETLNAISRTLTLGFQRVSTIETFDLEKISSATFESLRTHFPSDKSQIFNFVQLQSLFASAGIKKQKELFSTAAVAPLILRDQFYGIIVLFNKEGESLDGSVFNMLDLITPRISLAIENAQLYAKAQSASQAKSDFLANISHEVRTPLSAIIGFAELAQEKAEPHTFIAESLATITRNGHQLLSLVNEILDLSKVESNKMELERMNFSVVALLKDVVCALGMKAKQKNIQLEIDFKNLKNEYVISDSLRVRQILFNLLGNSLKFTSKGRILLRVTESPIDISHSELHFQLEDTGIGMSEAQQEKLFAPFEQGDSSVTRKYGGTGLGLFLSRKLAELMEGELTLVKSAPNEGSTFLLKVKVELPQASNLTPTEPAQVSELLPVEQPINDVLVVDDSAENRILMDAYLNRLQIPHDFAENGLHALEKMLTHKYSVVFMDVQMPEMDGISAIKKARKEGYSGKVVALTAHAMKGDREHCISHGFDDYLCKPLSRKTLEAFLQSKNQPLH